MKKLIHIVFGLILLAGFIVLLGTAGTSDVETVTFGFVASRCLISLVLMSLGFFGLKFTGCKYIN